MDSCGIIGFFEFSGFLVEVVLLPYWTFMTTPEVAPFYKCFKIAADGDGEIPPSACGRLRHMSVADNSAACQMIDGAQLLHKMAILSKCDQANN